MPRCACRAKIKPAVSSDLLERRRGVSFSGAGLHWIVSSGDWELCLTRGSKRGFLTEDCQEFFFTGRLQLFASYGLVVNRRKCKWLCNNSVYLGQQWKENPGVSLPQDKHFFIYIVCVF